MRQIIGDKSAEQLLAELSAEVESPADAIEPGEMTLTEWMKAWRVGKTKAAQLLCAGVATGKLKSRRVKMKFDDCIRHTRVWRAV